MSIEKLSDQQLLALGAEVNARWMGLFVERGLIPLACVCMRNSSPGDNEGAYEILASKGVDEDMMKRIFEVISGNYRKAEHINLK